MNACSVQSSLRRLFPLLLPLIAAALFLIGLNTFQYFQVKQELSSALVQGIAASDLRQVRTFFKNFELKLKIVREWGKNGVLDIDNTEDLNKKFMPFLQDQSNITGVLLADTRGREYYLMSSGGKLITRTMDPQKTGSDAEFDEWSAPESTLTTWHEAMADYDARKRPWFRTNLGDGEVFFSPIYRFYHSGQEGITASASWHSKQDPAELFVIGLDIHVDDISRLLRNINASRKTSLFLVNGGNGTLLTESDQQAEAGEAGELSREVLQQLAGAWQDMGKPVATAVSLRVGNRDYLASLQPVNAEDPKVWLGVAADEKALLSALNSDLFSFQLTDLLVVVAGGVGFLVMFVRNRHLLHGTELESSPEELVARLARQGEGERVEFKSTVRVNLATGKKGKEIELAWLKGVVAFLNSEGGNLLIGVNDGGEIVGLEADGFENDDKCLLHLKNCLHQHIGAEFSQFVSVTLAALAGGQVVLLSVAPSPSPAFLKIGKNEEFYIRSGPSCTKLAPSQIVAYVTQKKKV